LGLQLLLAQAASIRRGDGTAVIVLGSARVELLRIRGVITASIGERLGPCQRRWDRERLARIQQGGERREGRRDMPTRRDHTTPRPPQIRGLPPRLKAKIAKWLNAA